MLRFLWKCLPLVWILAHIAAADPLAGSLELGTSISQSYDARSVFGNPAALGFQTELNGAGLATSVDYGYNRTGGDDFALGISYGYFGFGWERYSLTTDTWSRFGFALGIPLHPNWYLGTRYVLNRFQSASGFDSLDLGLQFRPASYLSFGIAANRLNQPSASPGGPALPWQLVLGATIRPIRGLELIFDADTMSGSSLLQQWGYQAAIAAEVVSGLKIQVGYHSDYQFQLGLQLQFDRASLRSSFAPSSNARQVLAGLDVVDSPYKSGLLKPRLLKIGINSQLGEKPAPNTLFATPRPTLLGLLDRLDEASRHPEISRVAVRIESFPLGLASAEEVHRAVLKLREGGKQVDVYLGNAGLKEYLIASAANRIHMEPQAELKLLGLRSEHYYLRGTLDKIGVEGEFLARGEYKSAPEMFTRRESSPVNRAAAWEELKEADAHVTALLQHARKLDKATLARIYETAMYSPQGAIEAKLIDSVDSLESSDGWKLAPTHFDERSNALALPPRIAVIVAEGDILDQKIRALSLTGQSQITPSQMRKQFEEALADSRTAAIVLRVNSPGGEILPSHEIGDLIEKARDQKPVIISMGDVAASGGYYIAAPGEAIFAGPLTYTGSIGVFLGKVNAAGLFKTIQLNKEILGLGPHAGILSEDRPWTASDRSILTRRLNEYYTGFVSYVAKHRGLTDSAAENAAKGRVWLGKLAKGLKLVDQEGGYLDAIAFAAVRGDVARENYEVWLLPEPTGLLGFFGDDGWLKSKISAVDAARGLLSETTLKNLVWIESLRKSPFLFLSPVAFESL